MKKNKMMRIASVLLVAVLLSTCAIFGTFAKYTTSTTGTDKARVAYWGWDHAATLAIDMFDETYTNVASSGEVDGFENVIAPGTGKTTTFAFGYTNYKTDKIGAPEVAYTFTVTPTITGDYDSLDANKNFYWTLKAPGAADATKYGTVDELLAAVKALSGDASGTKVYAPGQLPTAFTAADQVYTIGWVWEIGTGVAAEDEADTIMGNSQTLENVTFTITITATQND